MNLYVNGVKVGSTQFDNNPVLENINFGARGVYGDRFFEGLIDEVRIWSTALTQSEIQANMTNYLAGTETGLLAYYRLNDVAGQTAWDFTGHGFDAQLGSSAGSDINDPAWVQTNWAYDTYLLADFAADQQSGYAPLEVQFTDFSMNEPDGWQWDFENDGNMDATDQNPQWTYNFPGTYDVRLVISKGTDTDTIVRNNFIVVGVSNPITIAEARLQPLGSIVTVTGIVTCGNEFGNLHFIQDPTAGAGIYDPNITDLRMGDSIVIMGETAEFNGLFELINNNYYAIISSNNALPAAQLVDVASLGEDYECEIVRINNVNFPYGGNSFLASTDYDLIDPSGTTHFRINGSSPLVFQRAPETTIDLTGICVNRTDDIGFPYGIYGRDYADLIYKNLQDFQLQDAGFTKRYSMVNSVSAVDGNTAWAIAKDGKNQFNVQEIIRTTDAGQNWEVITVPDHDGLVNTSIFALDENNAWVMSYRQWGSNPQGIYYTGDGGVTWAHQSTATFDPTVGAFPDIVHFWDANTGVCMGDPSYGYFEIYTTSDGGATWSRVPQANIPDPLADEYGITDNYSVVDNTIWFTTNKGRIYKSADQGLNWTVYQTPISTYGIVDFKNQTDGLLISQNDNSLFESAV